MADILFVSFNRLAFTQAAFTALLRNTEWDEVEQLLIADDASTDGTAEWLTDEATRFSRVTGVETLMHPGPTGGPVAAMNWALDNRSADADRVAKIDNDFVVCPGWLPEVLRQMTINPGVDVFGLQPRFGPASPPPDYTRTVEECRHIGGIGVMRHRMFELCRPVANGRFGWTEYQTEHPAVRKAWVTPDLPCFSLGQIAAEPWVSLAREYIQAGWMREWPEYVNGGRGYYEWWLAAEEAAA